MLLYLTDSYCTTHATISPLCHSERSGTDIENQAIKSKNAAESNPEGAPAGGISALVYGLIAERIPLSTGCEAARCNNSLPPKPTKASPKSTRPEQSESKLRSAQAGALGGSSGRLREVWREKRRFCKAKSADSGFAALNSPPKGGSFSIQGLPFPHFVSSSSTSSANISATVGLCSTGFGVTSPALIKAHLVRDGPTNS